MADSANVGLAPLLSSMEQARMPIKYMASLFAGGNIEAITEIYRKLIAVRLHTRYNRVGDVPAQEVQEALSLANLTCEEAENIFRLTSMPTFEERFVIPPLAREQAIESTIDPFAYKPAAGFGFRKAPARRF